MGTASMDCIIDCCNFCHINGVCFAIELVDRNHPTAMHHIEAVGFAQFSKWQLLVLRMLAFLKRPCKEYQYADQG